MGWLSQAWRYMTQPKCPCNVLKREMQADLKLKERAAKQAKADSLRHWLQAMHYEDEATTITAQCERLKKELIALEKAKEKTPA